jgi:CBS domain-containing protein
MDGNRQMAAARIEVESQIVELSTKAFQAFCDGISETFDVDIKCEQQQVANETVADLKKRFKKLVAVNVVDSKGLMEGTFQLIFDHDGLFTLGGIITNLSEKEILDNRKVASAKRAESMVDAVGEAGNLLATSFDEVFREGLDGHDQFSPRLPAFIGKPWSKPEEKIGLAKNEELVFIQYEITAGSFVPFQCGVIFPKTIFVAASYSEAGKARATKKKKAKQETIETETAVKKISEDASSKESTEEVAEDDKNEKPEAGKISEIIQKMAQSSAVLSGEPDLTGSAKRIKLGGISELSQIRAEEIMRRRIAWVKPEDSVQRALATMQQKSVGYLMAGRDGLLEGIVSQSDIAGAISPYLRPVFAKWRRPSDDATLQIKVKWIMSKPVRIVGTETSLATVIDNICKFGVRALPVVDEQDQVQGLITAFDILRILLN